METRKPSGAEIAVIAAAGRFPGAPDVETFWQNLLEGRESVTFFTDDELRAAGVRDEMLARPDYVKARPTLAGVDLFDADFFRLSPREARFLDPQQRIFLECAWEALERGGYDAARTNLRIGVFAGASVSTYLLQNLAQRLGEDHVDRTPIMFGNVGDFLPTRVSYKLGLTGPSVNVQTACSTSLSAIHLACQNLLAGESDMALAGGVSVLVPQAAGYLRQADSIMSPDGHCRAFDAEGQGTIFGSGVGVVLLKRLADALRDRDPVLAVVLGGAMNNDGANKMGYSAPSLLGQSEAIAEALSAADVTPDAVGYVEAHGTATALGDPIEVAALARAFGGAPRAAKCALGSVKSNFGHLDIASGIAGFIKAVLVVRHGAIPPSLHFKRPNPALNLDQTPFAVNAARRDWPDDGRPRRAGVSSFGIGGTNVHVVLEQPPAPAPRPPPREGAELLVLSAKTRPALDEATARLAAHLEARPDLALADVAHTLGVGRRLFEERRFVVAADPADAIDALRSHGPPRLRTRRGSESAPRLVFAFPGQGSQYPNMGLALFRREEAFRADLRRCAALFERALGRDLLPLIYPPADADPSAGAALEAADVVQPAIFAVEYALARQLERWGLRPAAVVGHSIGEYAAACFAGVFSLEDAVTAVALRSRLMAATAPGAMLAVPLDEAAARALVGPELDLAAVNAPSLVVLSGRPEAVDAAETLLRQRGVETRRLRVQRANHSAAMTSVVEPFRQGLAKLAFAAPKVPLLSTVTAAWLDAKTATDPSYWATQLRQTVRFADAVKAIAGQPDTLFVEVGPGEALASLARRQGVSAVATLPARAGVEEAHAPLSALGELWAAGAPLDWTAFSDGHRHRVRLPTYPFQRQRHWVDPPADPPADRPADRAGSGPEARPADAPASDAPPERAAPADGSPPLTALEAGLCAIWQALLGVERVGLDDDFYALGGDSLLGTQVASRIRAQLGVEVRVRDLFDAPTVGALARLLERRASVREAPLERRPPGSPARLSFAQERLWFLEQLEPGTAAYNIPSALRLEGKLDVDALRRALREVVRRHETLRTTFGVDPAGLPLPVVHDDAPFALTTQTLDAPPAERERALFEAGRRAAGAPFDVARGPLVRAELWQLGEDDHALFFTMHHLVSDGWSVGVLVREVTALYLAFTANQPSPLPDLPIQYADFAAWQREKLSGPELARQLEHWKAELAGAPAALDLPTDRPRPATQSYAGAHFTRPLPPGLLDELEALGRSLSATPFMLFLAAYAALLARHTGRSDLVIGTPIANRTRVEAEGLIGMFVNTLALRADLRGEPSFTELVARLKARTLAAYAHQDLPFERLVEGLGVSRDPSRSPVFQTMFTLQNTPQESIAVSGLQIAPLAVESGTSQFDLSLDVIPAQAGHLLQWEYNTDLFDRATIERLAAHFEALLGAAVASPDAPLGRLRLLDATAERLAHADWNATAADYPRDQTVHGLFEAQARQTPDAMAVEHEGRSLTYAQLDARADALARHLVALGAGPSSVVAVCMARSPDLIATLLAALKANAAYLPIDPSYPPDRIAHLLADSGARFVAVDRPDALAGLRPEALAGIALVCPADVVAPDVPDAPPGLAASVAPAAQAGATAPVAPDAPASQAGSAASDAPDASAVRAGSAAPDATDAPSAPARAAPPSRASDAAYVIYTSGSTGTPKGVVVEHRSVVNYLLSFGRTAGLGASDRLLQFASPSFDVSVEEIFGTLAHGATLVLRTDAMLESVEAFLGAAAELRLSVLDLPTAYWGELTEGLARGARLPAGVRLVVLGGEKARREVLARWLSATPPSVRLLNAYGPTEATIAATIAELSALPPGDIPIGRPVANARAYVLDAYGEEAPVGVPGELFLGGDCLARGYLRRPALTAERFVPDPFGGAGERLYRTGDRARRLPDGMLEFLGRDDDQVKVRGFRVELGEIEAALIATPSVREAAVVARGEGGARGLFAYVVTGAEGPDASDLRRQLRARLPEYMVPSLAIVDALPRSPNGKIDRRALATHESHAGATDSSSFVAPRNEAEAALCAIWQEVLGVERVGVEDDFFALGGSSLLVIRLSVLARERLGLALSVSSIMGRPTIAALAEGSLAGSHLVSFGAGGSAGAGAGAGSGAGAGAGTGWSAGAGAGAGAGGSAEAPSGSDASSNREAVVFVHSLSGEAFPYLELAKHLPGYATYGLRSPVADEAVPFATLAELATLHADALAALERPVHLVGWSSGGVIAHEIAHQLDALGCPARSLTLLDPPPPGREDSSTPDYVAALLSLLGDRPLSRPVERADDAAAAAAEALACDVATARQLLATQATHYRLVAEHEPSGISTPTLVLACGERDDVERWQDFAPTQTGRAPGDHYSLLRSPHAEALARQLAPHFADA